MITLSYKYWLNAFYGVKHQLASYSCPFIGLILIQAHLDKMRAISFISALLVLPAAFASPIDFELDSRAGKSTQPIDHTTLLIRISLQRQRCQGRQNRRQDKHCLLLRVL